MFQKNQVTLTDFEDLFVNNPDLDAIKSHLNKFNPIKTMRMERMEIRHSAILAWLLDPQETHGLGDDFLRSFLAEAFRGRNDKERPNALDIIDSDMMDAEVRREWHNIDLLIVSHSLDCAFVIENKYDSVQHSKQLTRYIETVKDAYGRTSSDLTIKGVFLTLWDEEPDDKRYAPINYSKICELLPRLVDARPYPLSIEVSTFIEQYLDVIKEATGMNEKRSEMEELARKLYREHRRLIDFIVDYGKITDFSMATEDLFGTDPDWMSEIQIDESTLAFNFSWSNGVNFLPQNWYIALGRSDSVWEGCESWCSGHPLIVYFRLDADREGNRGKLRLFAQLGPLRNNDVRKSFITAIEDVAVASDFKTIKFQSNAASSGTRVSKFLKGNTLDIKDVNDSDEIKTKMRKLLKQFKPEFDAIAEMLHGLTERIQKNATNTKQ